MAATNAEKHVFGNDVRLHPITKRPLESGIGCLPDDMQALNVHCVDIERESGRAKADEMRAKLKAAAAGPREHRVTPNSLKALEKSEGKEAAAALVESLQEPEAKTPTVSVE